MKFRRVGIAVVGLALTVLVGWPFVATRLTRMVEDRLERETGRDWRVGSVGIAWSPALLLTDVATGDAAAGLTVGHLTVPLSLALITGGTASVSLRADGLSLRLPIDGPLPTAPARAGDGASRSEAHWSAVHARLRGVDCALSGDGRRLDLSAGSVEIDLDLDASATAPAIDLTIEDAGQPIRLVLDRPGGDGARSLRLDIAPNSAGTDLPAVRVAARLIAGADQVSLDRITGTLDQSPVSGMLRVALAGRPVITADLRLEDLTLKAGRDADLAGVARGPKIAVPIGALPRPSWFTAFDGDLRLAIGRVALGPARFEEVNAATNIRGGKLESAVTVARTYESALTLRYTLSPVNGARGGGGENGLHRLSVSLAGARLRPLLSDLVGAEALDAKAMVRIDLQANAAHPADLPRAATGFADVTLTEGRVDTADLIGLGNDGPFSRFNTLGGSFSIAEGRAVTNDLQLRSPLIQAIGAGSLDLVARTLDLRFQPSVTSQRGRSGSGRALNVPVHVSGPWEGPAVSADMAGLLQNPGGAIEALQDLGTGLMGPRGDGGGLGGLLDAILPRGGRESTPARRR